MSKVRGVNVSFHLVGRVPRDAKTQTPSEVAKANPTMQARAPRIDIGTSGVDARGGRTQRADVAHLPNQSGGAVPAGGGVLGFRLGAQDIAPKSKPAPDAGVLYAGDGPLDGLAASIGESVHIEFYDKNRYGTLDEAKGRGDVHTAAGTLVAVEEGTLHVERDGELTRVRPRRWQVGRVVATDA